MGNRGMQNSPMKPESKREQDGNSNQQNVGNHWRSPRKRVLSRVFSVTLHCFWERVGSRKATEALQQHAWGVEDSGR